MTGPLSPPSVIGCSGLAHSLTEWVSGSPGGRLGVEVHNEDHLSRTLKYGPRNNSSWSGRKRVDIRHDGSFSREKGLG